MKSSINIIPRKVDQNIKKLLYDQRYILFGVVLLAISLRLLGLANIELGGDFAYHWEVAGGIVENQNLPLLGPVASINSQIHLGPFYYYLLSIPYLIGQGNYKVAIIFFSLLNSISIFPLYYVSKKWLGVKRGFQVIILFALSNYIIQLQNFPWNPYIVPLLVTLSLYALVKLQEKRLLFLPVLALLLSLGIQAHATFVFLIPIFLIFVPFSILTWRLILLSLLLFLLPLSPWFYSELTSNFTQLREVAGVFSPHNEVCDFYYYLKSHGQGERCFHQIRNTLFMFRLISQSLFATRNLIFVMISFLITLFTLIKTKKPKKSFLLTWFLGVFLFFMFYSENIYLHFFLILIPLPFIIFTLFLEEIGKKKKHGLLFSDLVFISVVCWNVFSYINSLFANRL